MPRKPATTGIGRRRNTFRRGSWPSFESLESRQLLAGDFTNTLIDDATVNRLLHGLDDLSSWADSTQQLAAFSAPLGLVTSIDDERISLASILDLGGSITEKLAEPIQGQLETADAAQRDTDALISFLASLPHVTAVAGGLTTEPTEEVRFEIQFSDQVTWTELGLDLGADAASLGLDVEQGIETMLVVDVTYDLSFGVQLDPNLSDEQAFFLRDSSIALATDLHAVELEAVVAVGIVESAGTFSNIDVDLDLELSWNDLVPDPYQNITLSEINGFDITDVARVRVLTDSLSAELHTNPVVGSWTAPGSPTVTLTTSALGDLNPAVTTNTDFDELINFSHVDPRRFKAGLDALRGWLEQLGNSTAFYLELPFLAETNLAAVFDPAQPLEQILTSLVRANGDLRFDSLTDLANLIGVDFQYEPSTNRLTMPFSLTLAGQAVSAAVAVDGAFGHVADIQASGEANVEARGSVDFVLSIDLSEADASIENQFAVSHMELGAEVNYLAADVIGSLRYGMVGLDFERAAVAGSLAFLTEIVNPFDASSFATLGDLEVGLLYSPSLLASPISPQATANFHLGDLAVTDNLFAVDTVELELAQNSYAGLPELFATGDTLLSSLAAIDVDYLANELFVAAREALGATHVLAGWNELVGMVPIVGDTGSLFMDPAGFLDLALVGSGNGQPLLLQDIPGAISNLPALAGFAPSVDLSVDAANATLTFELSFATTFPDVAYEFGMNFGAGLGEAIGATRFGDSGEFAGGGGEVTTDLSAGLDIDVLIDFSAAQAPRTYVLDSTRATAELYVNDQVELAGSLGILGAEFAGTLIVAGDISSPSASDPATISVSLADRADGRYPLDGSIAMEVDRSATGQLLVDYEFTSTPNPAELAHLEFTIDDLNDVLNSLEVQGSPNFQSLIDNLNIGDNLSGLPAALLDILDAIAQATDDGIFGIQLPIIGNLLTGDGNFLHNLRDTFADGLSGLTQFDAAFLEGVLESIVAELLHEKLEDVDDRVSIDPTNLDDIKVTLDLSGTIFEASKRYDTNLGFPALGAELNAEFGILGTYTAVFMFGVDRQGIYLVTEVDEQNPAGLIEERLSIDLSVNVQGQATEPDIEGRLGFVTVDIDNAGEDAIMHANFVVDITEPSGDGKLRLDEALSSIGSLVNLDGSGLSGGTGAVDGDAFVLDIGVGVGEWAPSLYATLEIEWEFEGLQFSRDTPRVEYKDVGIELGNFMTNTMCPFVQSMASVFGFFDPVLKVFDTEVPIVSDVLGETTILDMANLAEDVADLIGQDKLEQNLATVTTFVEILGTIDELDEACDSGEQARISFGSLSLEGLTASAQEVGLEWINDHIDLTVEDPMEQIERLATDFYEATQNVNFTGGQVEFPIFEQPLSAFEWLLGIRQIPIVTLEVAQLSVDLELPLTFPLGPIYVGLEGGLQVEAGISVGYDTLGFSDFFDSKDPLDLFNGFYISDTPNADGTGNDSAEIGILGSLALVAGIGFEDFGVGVKGGLTADVELDLLDHNGDGRVRGSELNSEEGCMVISGSVGIAAGLELSALGILEADIPFGSEQLASFDYTVHCRPVEESELAYLNEDTGVLTLLVGDDARLRLISPDVEDEYYVVRSTDTQLVVEAFNASQQFEKNAVQKIVANAGSGHDTIIINASVSVDAELDGGEGENKLVGGGGDDTITGGSQRDILDGGDGVDTIRGEGGDDVIYGGGAGDFLFGGTGKDYIDGQAGNDTIEGNEQDDQLFGGADIDTISGNDGIDFIDGGDQGDFLYGQQGADTINGGAGGDFIEGGSEADTINGGDFADIIDGGADIDIIHGDGGSDTIDGGTGADLLFGDDGEDTIYGGPGEDTIEGGRHNDELFGDSEADTIRGGEGDDIIEGGIGDDVLYGEDDDDRIYGNAKDSRASLLGSDRDDIYGGPGDDTAFGQDGSDRIFGEDGEDNLHGGDGADEIYGGHDADEIYGDDGEDLLVGEWGNDRIEGGEQNDVIRGMTGNDALFGEGGEDHIFGDDGSDYAEGGTGHDTIEGGTGDDELQGNEANDTMHGGLGNDTMDGGAGEDQMFGQQGNDTMYGGAGSDVMYGEAGRDAMYGENGEDRMFGGAHNDTMRGGAGIDVMEGDDGDDLMLGNDGDDQLLGGPGNDVLRGNDGNDRLTGDAGDDRAMGGAGDDILAGNQGNDILEGGPGNDDLRGAAGDDQLHGDEGVDFLDGGPNDDYLWAGDGIGNELRGGDGDDTIVGSDEGQDDPNLFDAIVFGDVIFGGEGNDIIDGLGGADLIDAGPGNDEVRGGTHGDLITGGPAVSAGPDQDMLYGGRGADTIRGGADRDELYGGEEVDTITGNALDYIVDDGVAPAPAASLSNNSSPGDAGSGSWASLYGSASTDGLSQIGGFEQASYAADGGVYVAWVDTRNGNSEIYVAFRADIGTFWQPLAAAEGGVSNDPEASRRPSLVRSGDNLLVAWTMLDDTGGSLIKAAALDLKAANGWTQLSPPAVVGNGDHSQLVAYPEGALLAWLNENNGVNTVVASQYVACDSSFLAAGAIHRGQNADDNPVAFDLASDDGVVGAAMLVGEQETSLQVNLTRHTISLPYNCPNPAGPGFITIALPSPVGWYAAGTFSAENIDSPAIGLGNSAKREENLGQFEIRTQYAVDVFVAWDFETDHENQVAGRHTRKDFDGTVGEWEILRPSFNDRATPHADTISETIGYAALPSLATSDTELYMAWMDDGVHQSGGNGNSSIYVMSTGVGGSLLFETSAGEASGRGISVNGGALRELSIAVESTAAVGQDPPFLPYVSWTDAFAGRPQVYVRHDLDETAPAVIVIESDGRTRVSETARTDTYEIYLASQPTANVTLTLFTDPQLIVSPTTLTFSSFNWAMPRLVTVGARDNSVVDGNRSANIEHKAVSTDADYNNIGVNDVRVRIVDNDFNRDGSLNSKDIDILFDRLGKRSQDLRYDVNEDQQLNHADVDFLLADQLDTSYGDANLDGEVNFTDFLRLSQNFGRKRMGWDEGDFNGNGEVDFADFLELAANFGRRRERERG